MKGIAKLDTAAMPSDPSLFKATLGALIAAGVILVTTVLPAEYGIDPTGLGRAMGLNLLNQARAAEATGEGPPVPSKIRPGASPGPVWKADQAPRTDTLTLTLLPKQGVEIKSKMEPGDHFVFDWKAEGGRVYFDMHGEPINAEDRFTSYWIGQDQAHASGTFFAPFAGIHGWYWENRGETPVTIALTTSGFYTGLYMP